MAEGTVVFLVAAEINTGDDTPMNDVLEDLINGSTVVLSHENIMIEPPDSVNVFSPKIIDVDQADPSEIPCDAEEELEQLVSEMTMLADLRDENGKLSVSNMPKDLLNHWMNEYLKSDPLEMLWLSAKSFVSQGANWEDIIAQVQQEPDFRLFWIFVENCRIIGEEVYTNPEDGSPIHRGQWLNSLTEKLKSIHENSTQSHSPDNSRQDHSEHTEGD